MYGGHPVIAVELPADPGAAPVLLRPLRIEGPKLVFTTAAPEADGSSEAAMELLEFLARFAQGGRALVGSA